MVWIHIICKKLLLVKCSIRFFFFIVLFNFKIKSNLIKVTELLEAEDKYLTSFHFFINWFLNKLLIYLILLEVIIIFLIMKYELHLYIYIYIYKLQVDCFCFQFLSSFWAFHGLTCGQLLFVSSLFNLHLDHWLKWPNYLYYSSSLHSNAIYNCKRKRRKGDHWKNKRRKSYSEKFFLKHIFYVLDSLFHKYILKSALWRILYMF